MDDSKKAIPWMGFDEKRLAMLQRQSRAFFLEERGIPKFRSKLILKIGDKLKGYWKDVDPMKLDSPDEIIVGGSEPLNCDDDIPSELLLVMQQFDHDPNLDTREITSFQSTNRGPFVGHISYLPNELGEIRIFRYKVPYQDQIFETEHFVVDQ